MYWNYGWGMGFGWCFMVVFWVIVIAAIISLIRLVAVGGKKKEPAEDTALDILKKRYARGEINKEEFEEKRRDIQ